MLILFLLFFSLRSALFHFATEKSPKMKREQGKSDITIFKFFFFFKLRNECEFLKAACFSVGHSGELLSVFSTELKIIAISL